MTARFISCRRKPQSLWSDSATTQSDCFATRIPRFNTRVGKRRSADMFRKDSHEEFCREGLEARTLSEQSDACLCGNMPSWRIRARLPQSEVVPLPACNLVNFIEFWRVFFLES